MTMKKKLLGLLLCASLLMQLLPLQALADSTISSVSVQIEWPYAYCNPQYAIKCYSSDYHLKQGADTVWWYDETAKESIYKDDVKPFVKGHTYTVYMWLETADGYKFSYNGTRHSVTARVNGQTATVSKAYEQDKYRVIQVSLSFKALKEGVAYVDLEIPAFYAGDKPAAASSIVRDPEGIYDHTPFYVNEAQGGAEYISGAYRDFVKGVAWYDRTTNTGMNAAAVFQRGHRYSVTVALQVNPAYYGFWADLDPAFHGTARVNGDENVSVQSNALDPNTYIFVTYDFPDPVTQKILFADVTNVKTPLGGETSAYTAEVVSPGYSVSGFTSTGSEGVALSGYHGGVRWYDETLKQIMKDTDVFLPGRQYSVRVILEADSGFLFPVGTAGYDLAAQTINGADAQIVTQSFAVPSGDFARYLVLEYRFSPAGAQTVSSFAVQDVTLPRAGQSPSYGGLSVTGDGCDVYTSHNKESAGVYHGVQWLLGGKAMKSGDVFEAGKDYTVKVWVTAERGYEFDPKAAGTVNGQPAAIAFGDTYGWASAAVLFHCSNELLTDISVDFAPPEGGRTPTYQPDNVLTPDCVVKDVTGGGYQHGVAWFDRTTNEYLEPDDVFVKGHAYSVFAVMGPDTGYEFAVSGGQSAVSCTINGLTVEPESADPRHELTLRYDFPEPCGGIRVSLVQVTIRQPQAGLEADRAPQVPADAPYAATPSYLGYTGGVQWFDVTDNAVLNPGTPFVKGHLYEARILLDALDGYEFDTAGASPAVMATVNGAVAAVTDLAANSPRDRIRLVYAFPDPAEPIYATAVSLNIAAPVHGEAFDFAPSSLTGAVTIDKSHAEEGYTDGVAWYDEDAKTWLKPGDTALGGGRYLLYIAVKAEPGYELTDPLEQARINGDDVNSYEAEGTCFLATELLAPYIVIDPVTVTDVAAPWADAKPVFEASVPENADYTVREVQWWDYKAGDRMGPEATFTAGQRYDLVVILTPKPGCAFDEVSAAKLLNGEAVSFTLAANGELRLEKTYYAEVNTVKTVAVMLPQPSGGQTPVQAADVAVPKDAGFRCSKVVWYDETDKTSDFTAFTNGHTYTVTVTLDADWGAAFAPEAELTALLNAAAAEIVSLDSKTCTIRAQLVCKAIVSSFDAAMTGYDPGASDKDVIFSVPEDAPYEIAKVEWTDLETPALVEGEVYNVRIDLIPKEGFEFSAIWDEEYLRYLPTDDVMGSLDGRVCWASVFNGEDARHHITLDCGLPPCGKTILDNIEVSGLPAPAAGLTLLQYRSSTFVTLPEDAHYLYDDIACFDTEEKTFLENDDVFVLDRVYTVCVAVKAEDGYAFPANYNVWQKAYWTEGVMGKLNGELTDVGNLPGTDGRYSAIVASDMTAREPFVPAIDLTGPAKLKAGEKAPFALTVPADALYDLLSVSWRDVTAGSWLSDGDVFVGGHEYDLVVQARVRSPYTFWVVETDGETVPNVAVTWNGKDEGWAEALSGNPITTHLMVRLSFTCPGGDEPDDPVSFTKVTLTDGTIHFGLTAAPESGSRVCAAAYDKSGRMTAVVFADPSADSIALKPSDGETVRLYLLDGNNAPVCAPASPE